MTRESAKMYCKNHLLEKSNEVSRVSPECRTVLYSQFVVRLALRSSFVNFHALQGFLYSEGASVAQLQLSSKTANLDNIHNVRCPRCLLRSKTGALALRMMSLFR